MVRFLILAPVVIYGLGVFIALATDITLWRADRWYFLTVSVVCAWAIISLAAMDPKQ